MNEDDYHSFDSNDVTEHLYNALSLFFSDKKNAYKYSLQKRYYDTAVEKRTTYNAGRLFKIITGTNLVTKKANRYYKNQRRVKISHSQQLCSTN